MTRSFETDSFIRKSLEKAHSRLPAIPGSASVPHDIGIFLSQSVQMLDLLADNLVEGKHMRANTKAAIQQLEKENDLSEIESLDSLIETHAILRKIRNRIHNATVEVQLLWDEVPPPPVDNYLPTEFEPGSNSISNDEAANAFSVYQADEVSYVGMSADEIPPQYPAYIQPDDSTAQAREVTDLAQDIQSVNVASKIDLEHLLEDLESRGSGTYSCPYGVDCKKGAVKENGELVVFTRNSHFRAHVAKHMKRYKCDLPNCPTRKGFSRRDQLKRHQETVKHSPM